MASTSSDATPSIPQDETHHPTFEITESSRAVHEQSRYGNMASTFQKIQKTLIDMKPNSEVLEMQDEIDMDNMENQRPEMELLSQSSFYKKKEECWKSKITHAFELISSKLGFQKDNVRNQIENYWVMLDSRSGRMSTKDAVRSLYMGKINLQNSLY